MSSDDRELSQDNLVDRILTLRENLDEAVDEIREILGVKLTDPILVGTASRYLSGSSVVPNDVDVAIGLEDSEDQHVRRIITVIAYKLGRQLSLKVSIHTLPLACVPEWSRFRMTAPKECRGYISGSVFSALSSLIGYGILIGYKGLQRKTPEGVKILTQDPNDFLRVLSEEIGINLTGSTFDLETRESCLHSLLSVTRQLQINDDVALARYDGHVQRNVDKKEQKLVYRRKSEGDQART